MRPIKDNLLVKNVIVGAVDGDGNAITNSGIVIVGKLDSTLRGEVLKTGADVKEIAVGEIVLYYDGQGLKFTEAGQDYILIREGEISLVL